MRRLALSGAIASCLAALATAAGTAFPSGTSDDAPPIYTNAQVVAVDVVGRTLVIRNVRGLEEKVQLDDTLGGFGDIRAGDQVILTLRTGPGWTRVSSIVKSKAKPAPKVAARSSARPAGAPVGDSQARASREAFGAQVAGLAEQADRVDRVWDEFRKACHYQPGSPNERSRGWFVLWEGSIRADLSGGFCRDLFNQVVDLGEPVTVGMAAAEDVARRELSPGDIREIRGRYGMEWGGWGLAPPKRLEQ